MGLKQTVAKADENGMFSFHDVSEGKYSIFVTYWGYLNDTTQIVKMDQVLKLEIMVKPDTSIKVTDKIDVESITITREELSRIAPFPNINSFKNSANATRAGYKKQDGKPLQFLGESKIMICVNPKNLHPTRLPDAGRFYSIIIPPSAF